jgi:hypothetical protein
VTRTLVDSTNIQDDPTWAQLVAYYIDGIYATTEAAVRARFSNAVLVPISAIGTNAGIVGDVEPGCMTIPQAVTWVGWRRAAGVDPTLYVNETYGWAPCRAAFQAAGIPEPHWWVADYDGIGVIPVGAVAKQYENPTLTQGHFDLSVAADFWPGVDSSTHLGGDMPVLVKDPNSDTICVVFEQGNHTVKRHITLDEWTSYQAGGVSFQTPTTQAFAAVVALPDAQPESSNNSEPTKPSKITLDITSVPGMATGTVSTS